MDSYLIPLIWGKSSVLIGLDRVPSSLHLMRFDTNGQDAILSGASF